MPVAVRKASNVEKKVRSELQVSSSARAVAMLHRSKKKNVREALSGYQHNSNSNWNIITKIGTMVAAGASTVIVFFFLLLSFKTQEGQ